MLTQAQFDFVRVSTAKLESATYEQKNALFEAMDKIMNPVLAAAHSAKREDIELWLQALPLGYYRQTLRVVIIQRFDKPELNHAPVVKTAVAPAPVVASGSYADAINAALMGGE